MMRDKKDRYWFCTFNGLVCSDKTKTVRYTKKDGLTSDIVWSCYEDRDGNVWIGVEGGLFLFKNEKLELIKEMADESIRLFYMDKNDRLWAISYKNSYFIEDKKVKKFNLPEEILNSLITCMIQDKEGNYWFGTYYNGLYRYFDHKFENMNLNQNLTDNFIWNLCIDHEGSLWIATSEGGICRLKDTRFSVLTKNEGLPEDQVWGILEDNEGKIWIRTRGRLACFESGKVEILSKPFGLEKK